MTYKLFSDQTLIFEGTFQQCFCFIGLNFDPNGKGKETILLLQTEGENLEFSVKWKHPEKHFVYERYKPGTKFYNPSLNGVCFLKVFNSLKQAQRELETEPERKTDPILVTAQPVTLLLDFVIGGTVGNLYRLYTNQQIDLLIENSYPEDRIYNHLRYQLTNEVNYLEREIR